MVAYFELEHLKCTAVAVATHVLNKNKVGSKHNNISTDSTFQNNLFWDGVHN